MGFNIGISTSELDTTEQYDCNNFIDRRFFNWVSSYETSGDNSCIIQVGNHLGLNLHPLTCYLYTWDSISAQEIERHEQQTIELLELVSTLISQIDSNPKFIRKVNYETLGRFQFLVKLSRIFGGTYSNPWKDYFESKTVIADLIALRESLLCYQNKGVSKVFLTAG